LPTKKKKKFQGIAFAGCYAFTKSSIRINVSEKHQIFKLLKNKENFFENKNKLYSSESKIKKKTGK
jgi:hypothetical protein